MVHIDAKRVIETRIAESMGFDKYKQIMETVRKTDVSTDLNFQRAFNAFYRVRRNAEWRKAYYSLYACLNTKIDRVTAIRPGENGECELPLFLCFRGWRSIMVSQMGIRKICGN